MSKKIIYILLSSIVLIVIVTLGIFFYNRYKQNKIIVNNSTSTDIVGNSGSNENINNTETVVLPDKPTVEPEWYKNDKDGDGLIDDEEDTLGTNKLESDTDFDGISDKVEIDVYKTNPLSADTDGDGYNDGVEINSGHDPLK